MPRRFKAAERQRRALEFRKAGMSYADIARNLGYRSVSGAYQAVEEALRKTLREPAETVRTLELERLDMLLVMLMTRVKQGDFEAVDRVLRVMERRASLLGLDAPKRQDITSAGDKLTITLSLSDADEEGGD